MKKHNSFIFLMLVLLGSLLVVFSPNLTWAADSPQYGGTVTFNHFMPAGVLGNPLKFRGPDHEYIDNTLQTLIVPSNEKMGEFEPLLAESWELAPDKSHYIFRLRKDVKFHDGTDFNAQAVKWNLDKWINSPRPKLKKIKSIVVIDDYTVQFNLKVWESIILHDLAKDTYIISPTAFNNNGAKWADTHPVGTGPFKFKKYKRGTFVSFEKFDDYWKKGLPYLDGIKILMIRDPMTFSASFQRGELDAVRIDYILASELEKTGKYELVANPAGHSVLYFNSEDPKSIWSKKECREALEHAIDKEAFMKIVTKGFGSAIYEIIHSVHKTLPGPGTKPRTYDPEKARRLLKEAGVPNGTKVIFTYATDGPAGLSRDYVAIMIRYLAEIGLAVDPNGISFPAFVQKEAGPPLPNEIMIGHQRGGSNELLVSLNQTLGRGSIFFKGIKKPDGFYALLDKALQAEDKKRQVEYLYELEKIAYGDAMFVPVFSETFINAQHHYVTDAVWFWGKSPYSNLERAWINKKR